MDSTISKKIIQDSEETSLLPEIEEQKKITTNHFQLTDPQIPGQLKEKEETFASNKPIAHIYRIEDSELPTNFESPYTPLPNIVEFKRIIGNIMNALKFDRDSELLKKNEMVLIKL